MEPFEDDLRKSGLSDESIRLMEAEGVSAEEATNELNSPVPNGGYKIPYFDLQGKKTGHFRIRFLPALKDSKGKDSKYRQKKGEAVAIYFPPNIDRDKLLDVGHPIIITEGEKKAVKACQEGYCCIGLGGVDCWRSKTVLLTGEASMTDKPGVFKVKGVVEDILLLIEKVVPDLLEIPWEDREVFICFDSDYHTNPRVQNAAFDLSVYLSERQQAKVHVILMPPNPDGGKQAIDDYLVNNPHKDSLWELAQTNLGKAEPANIKLWLKPKLGLRGKLERDDAITCARAITNAMDNRGQAYRDPNTELYYYFDRRDHRLHEFHPKNAADWSGKSIGKLINQNYGLFFSADTVVLNILADRMAMRAQERTINPRRVCWTTNDSLYYQLSDSQMIRVTANNINTIDNGTDGILFLPEQVQPIALTQEHFETARSQAEPAWFETIRTMNLQAPPGLTLEEAQLRLAALFYLSPWFRRWRGLMLPLEIVTAEPNSGKTMLYNLRKFILTGSDRLNGVPTTMRDWHTVLAKSPAIWVCDNLDRLNKEMEGQFSDELARLITEPDPTVEQRKLYTDNDLITSRIDCVFAITCIKDNLLHKQDIQQRSIVVQLKAVEAGKRDSRWYERRIEGDGRAVLLADQLLVAQRFLQAVQAYWDPNYLSDNRLKHFEQCLLLMGIALNQEAEMRALIPKLSFVQQEQIASADPVMEALRAFADAARAQGHQNKEVRVKQIVEWIQRDPECRFSHVRQAENPHLLGRYMARHEHDVRHSVGLEPFARNNSTFYRILDRENKLEKT